jgi:hypothetical protein
VVNIAMVCCIIVAHFDMRSPDENRLGRGEKEEKRRMGNLDMPKIQEQNRYRPSSSSAITSAYARSRRRFVVQRDRPR